MRRALILAALAVGCLAPMAQAGLIFSFTEGTELAALASGTPAQQALRLNVIGGFQQAGALWSAKFNDNITINTTINFMALGAGILGQNNSAVGEISLTGLKAAMVADQTSADDSTAVASLPAGSTFSFRARNRAGAVQFDNDTVGANATDNSVITINFANAKALGLLPANNPASDGSITFSSSFSWDFDRSNGITGSAFDFVGVAAHEIGHSMGFISGVDIVDYYSGPNGPGKNIDLNGGTAGIGELDPFSYFNPLDLFRYSTASLALGAGVRDESYGGTPYFSIDSGVTDLGRFSTGSSNGDGRQASHWKDNLSLGIMDPTFGFGELGVITNLDVRGMDVIGWNLITAIPTPSSLAMLAPAAALILRRRRR